MNHVAFAGSVLALLLTAALVRGILRRRAARSSRRPAGPLIQNAELEAAMREFFAGPVGLARESESALAPVDAPEFANRKMRLTKHLLPLEPLQDEIEFPVPGTALYGIPLPQPDGHP